MDILKFSSILFLFFMTSLGLKATTIDFVEEEICACDPVGDEAALVALYNSTDGANWTNTWDLSQPMDTWYGVTTNSEGCVTCLDLDGESNCSDITNFSGNNLVGTIPTELANLSNLQSLNLRGNQLSGTIPTSLTNLSDLQYLNLISNDLSGSIPSELGNLSNLQHLSLAGNDLSGSIPPELANLNNLQELFLANNQLSGSIPSELGNLNNLQHLSLSSNQLSGSIPLELGNLNSLQVLNLKSNDLNGSIPTQLSNLTNLTSLDLSLNDLSSSIPSVLDNLTNLTHLYLNHNDLSGNIPIELYNMTNLRYLDLSRNLLNGHILPELGNLTNLISLRLSANQLSGNIPSEIGMLINLTQLYLYGNPLTGSIPPEFGNLTNLVTLFLYSTQLSGSIPPEFGNLSSLGSATLYSNQLSGNIPPELGNLTSLTSLSLGNNQLSGSIPPEIGNLTTIHTLSFANNQLSGCFPPELSMICHVEPDFSGNADLPSGGDFATFCANGTGACIPEGCAYTDSLALVALYHATDGANWANTWDLNMPMDTWYGVTLNVERCVKELSLDNNQLSGSIPVELGNLSNLTHLNFGYNQLTGSIPLELGNLLNLENLSLRNNQLSGSIPSDLGNLINLTHLYLRNNQLSGSIPVELGNLSNLILLINLQNNQLNGNIPVELSNLTTLEELNLNNNQLSGSIPVELSNLINLTKLNLQNNQLEGCFPIEFMIFCNITRNFTGNSGLPGSGDFTAFCADGTGGCLEPCAYSDSLALVALYNATDGVNWDNPWDLSQPMSTWNGITANEDGCITRVFLFGQNLNGTIPAELGTMTNLDELWLTDNDNLTGTIPAELGNLSTLRMLLISRNNNSGTIPAELSNLSNLEFLRLDGNLLTGNIPSEFAALDNLTSLILSNNQLSGSIPVELANMANIQSMSLNGNQLSGAIPSVLGNITSLQHISLANNQLNGCFPTEILSICDISYDFSGNPNLPGGGDFAAFCADGTGACNATDVWPGDTNNDCTVDLDDFFNLGIQHGKTGPIRPNANSTWTAQPAPDWDTNQFNGSNTKHADCNGDGTVDSNTDGAILSLNYGETCENATTALVDNFDGNTILQPTWPDAGVSTLNNNIQLHLSLEQLLGANIEFYGLGFTVDYSDLSTGANLSVTNSVMEESDGKLYTLSKDLGTQQMDVGLVRTDQANVNTSASNQHLCELTFTLDDITQQEELHLKFHNIKIIDNQGNEDTPMLGSSATVVFGEDGGNNLLSSPLNLMIASTFAQDCNNGGVATVVPSGGIAPYTYAWSNGSQTNDAQNLNVGMHQVTITDDSNNTIVGNIEVFGNCAILPLETLELKVSPQTSAIALDWTTRNEINVEKFEVQRALDGINFSTIASTIATNKSFNNYQWIDRNVKRNTTYYYRIKTVENNSAKFSSVQSARLNSTAGAGIILQPNPTRDRVLLSFQEVPKTSVSVAIYNQLGQQIWQATYLPNEYNVALWLDLENYDNGLYFIELTQDNQTHISKIIKH